MSSSSSESTPERHIVIVCCDRAAQKYLEQSDGSLVDCHGDSFEKFYMLFDDIKDAQTAAFAWSRAKSFIKKENGDVYPYDLASSVMANFHCAKFRALLSTYDPVNDNMTPRSSIHYPIYDPTPCKYMRQQQPYIV